MGGIKTASYAPYFEVYEGADIYGYIVFADGSLSMLAYSKCDAFSFLDGALYLGMMSYDDAIGVESDIDNSILSEYTMLDLLDESVEIDEDETYDDIICEVVQRSNIPEINTIYNRTVH